LVEGDNDEAASIVGNYQKGSYGRVLQKFFGSVVGAVLGYLPKVLYDKRGNFIKEINSQFGRISFDGPGGGGSVIRWSVNINDSYGGLNRKPNINVFYLRKLGEKIVVRDEVIMLFDIKHSPENVAKAVAVFLIKVHGA
jgi:hypothetical protein